MGTLRDLHPHKKALHARSGLSATILSLASKALHFAHSQFFRIFKNFHPFRVAGSIDKVEVRSIGLAMEDTVEARCAALRRQISTSPSR
jgi:hypothetical protein